MYDPATGRFLLRPSGNTRLANNDIPQHLVDQLGGHGTVNRELGQLAAADTRKTVGFVALYQQRGELVVRWNSGQVNFRNYGDRAAPLQFRQPIIDALQEATGLRVISQ